MLLVGSIVVTLLLAAVLLVLGMRGGRLELPRRPRHRRILPGGKAVPEDLSQDASTDEQRFLM